ncbi:leucine-rich repeat-containing protein [Cryptosporidium canis]|uniref:Leucine-rich repeat-containing protein n=1 Tax=Cryptosporidium canis TaxID=195482 RepID=A0A9D5DIY1_9CRYT|nr:leucine-rich repeat-containing protein [Cryptosporidium canis]
MIEWTVLSSNVELHFSGRKIMQCLSSNGAGLRYRIKENDLELCIKLDREFFYSLKKDILSLYWKFHIYGKFSIISKKKSHFLFSNAVPNFVYNLAETIARISPQCLYPSFKYNNYLISNYFPNNKTKLDFSGDQQTEKKQKMAKLEQFIEQDCNHPSESRHEGKRLKYTYKHSINKNKIAYKNNLVSLPDDLIFYILSMLTTPITPNQEDEDSCLKAKSFYKDDLVKSTNLAFINSKLLYFFRANAWQISISNKFSTLEIMYNYKNIGSLNVSNKHIKDSDIQEFTHSKNFPILINQLCITGINSITDSGLTRLLLRLKKLERLEITDCNRITGEFSFRVIGANSSIKYLKLGTISKQNLSISDYSLACLLNSNNKTSKLTTRNSSKLNILHLELLNCIGINKISTISECCCNAEYLDLRGCKNIQNCEFESFFGYLKNLKVLILANTNVDDQVIDTILEHCSEIEVLDISYCKNVSEEMIAKIPYKLKLITGLKLSYCLTIRTKTLVHILVNCAHLEVIDISGCCHLDFNLNNYRTSFDSKLRIIGAYRISFDPRKLIDWISSNKRLDDREIKILNEKELPISEFVIKFNKIKKQYLDRNKPIWIN